MNNRSVCPAFVLGGGVNALGIIRSLGRQGIPVYLFSSGKKGLAHYSRYTRSITLSDPASHQAIISDLLSQAQYFNDKPVLFYASDDYLEFVSENREQLSGQFLFSVASRDSVECVSKKEKFGKFSNSTASQRDLVTFQCTKTAVLRMLKCHFRKIIMRCCSTLKSYV